MNRKQKCNISPPEQKLNCKLTTILTLTRTGQTEVTFELKLKRMMCFGDDLTFTLDFIFGMEDLNRYNYQK